MVRTLHNFNKFLKLQSDIKLLMLDAFFCSLCSKICISILTFNQFSKAFGILLHKYKEQTKPTIKSASDTHTLFQSIELVNRFLPWKTTCLIKAHTAALMLRRRKQSFNTIFGVRKSLSTSTPINAHAWIEIGDSLSFGKDQNESFNLIASYHYNSDK